MSYVFLSNLYEYFQFKWTLSKNALCQIWSKLSSDGTEDFLNFVKDVFFIWKKKIESPSLRTDRRLNWRTDGWTTNDQKSSSELSAQLSQKLDSNVQACLQMDSLGTIKNWSKSILKHSLRISLVPLFFNDPHFCQF